jgi:hypothetical protein
MPRSESLPLTLEVFKALQTRALRGTRVVGKVYNLCRVKTNISAVLMVKSGLNPHMIIELKDDLNRCFSLIYLCCCYLSLLFILVYTYTYT